MTVRKEFTVTRPTDTDDLLTSSGFEIFQRYKSEGKIVDNLTEHTINEDGTTTSSGYLDFVDQASLDAYVAEISGHVVSV